MILDANKFSEFLRDTDDMKPVRKWIDNKGKIVYSEYSNIFKEFARHSRMNNKLAEWKRSGKVKLIPTDKVKAAIESINENHSLTSNDLHILGLAKAGNITLLCSDDRKLGNDFIKIMKLEKRREQRNPKVYRNKSHEHLLKSNTCP